MVSLGTRRALWTHRPVLPVPTRVSRKSRISRKTTLALRTGWPGGASNTNRSLLTGSTRNTWTRERRWGNNEGFDLAFTQLTAVQRSQLGQPLLAVLLGIIVGRFLSPDLFRRCPFTQDAWSGEPVENIDGQPPVLGGPNTVGLSRFTSLALGHHLSGEGPHNGETQAQGKYGISHGAGMMLVLGHGWCNGQVREQSVQVFLGHAVIPARRSLDRSTLSILAQATRRASSSLIRWRTVAASSRKASIS